MQVLLLSLSSVLTLAFICLHLFFPLWFRFFLFCPFLVCLLRGFQKERTHMHTHYLGQTGSHLRPVRVAVLLHKHIASVWCLFHMLFKWYLFSSLCRYHHLHWLLGKQWSHRHRWRTKRTDRIRHSVQPKWPGTSSDQTDLLQLHSSSSL